jgi:hypothetical protein
VTPPHPAIHSRELIHRSDSLAIGSPDGMCSVLFAVVQFYTRMMETKNNL